MPMWNSRLIIHGLVLLAICGWAGQSTPVLAQDDVTEAKAAVRDLGEDALSVLREGLNEEQLTDRFRNMLNHGFDVPFIARFVLGRYWRVASPEQRDEYVDLFEQLIVQTYVDRFQTYSGETFEVQSGRRDGRDIFVQSRIVRPGDAPPIKVEWRVRERGDHFKIIDVVVEGVSMAITQRNEFASVIQRKGGRIEGLLEELREKVDGRQQA